MRIVVTKSQERRGRENMLEKPETNKRKKKKSPERPVQEEVEAAVVENSNLLVSRLVAPNCLQFSSNRFIFNTCCVLEQKKFPFQVFILNR